MKSFQPLKIFIELAVKDETFSQNVLNNLKGVPYEYIEDAETFEKEHQASGTTLTQGKKILLLKKFKGQFIKPCPGMGDYICCNYWIINTGYNCNLECSYCILQAYLNTPIMTLHANVSDLIREIQEKSASIEGPIRIGTGEFSDSLSLDDITGLSQLLIPPFLEKKNIFLEMKTKSNFIQNLLNYDGQKRITISFSLSTDYIQKAEEHLTASLLERLEAAKRLTENNYLVAFHFDPLIHYEGWQEDYAKTIKQVFETIPEKSIHMISMGSLRFLPHLKDVILSRFPKTKIMSGEFIRESDGKMRYFRKIRESMYTEIRKQIKQYSSRPNLYMCMENENVWEKIFGEPQTEAKLNQELLNPLLQES
jgi:spore photoproduct lyase